MLKPQDSISEALVHQQIPKVTAIYCGNAVVTVRLPAQVPLNANWPFPVSGALEALVLLQRNVPFIFSCDSGKKCRLS
jgi:hypothetical protein